MSNYILKSLEESVNQSLNLYFKFISENKQPDALLSQIIITLAQASKTSFGNTKDFTSSVYKVINQIEKLSECESN